MVISESDERLMRQALAAAETAFAMREVPVGALFVSGDTTITAYNQKEAQHDPTAHAELLVLRAGAKKLGRWRLGGTLYTTLEPCVMCAGAIVQARIDRLVFGTADPKGGGCGSIVDVVREPRLNHRIEVLGGVLAEPASQLLQSFFHRLRDQV